MCKNVHMRMSIGSSALKILQMNCTNPSLSVSLLSLLI